MKLNKIFSALLLTVATAMSFSACDPVIPDGPGNGDGKDTTKTDTGTVVTPTGDTLTVANLLAMKEDGTLPAKDAGKVKYFVKGYIVGVYDFNATSFVLGGTSTVATNLLIADDPECADTYKVATVKLASGTMFQEALALTVHPENLKKEVLLHGIVEAYCGVAGVVNLDEAYINGEKVTNGIDGSKIDYQEGEMSVSDFLALEEIKNLGADVPTEQEYTVRGIVSKVSSVNLSYGNANFYISDGDNEFYCFQIKGLNGDKLVNGEQVQKGDIVTVKGKVVNYKGTTLEMKNGNIVRTTNTFDPSTPVTVEEISIAKALEIGGALNVGETSSKQYKIQGMVSEVAEASTQYGNLTFTIEDEDGKALDCFRLYYKDNKKYTSTDAALEVGDVVIVLGQINNYNGTIQVNPGYIAEHTK